MKCTWWQSQCWLAQPILRQALWITESQIVHASSVRSEADAKRLQAEFGDFFTPLILDITDEAAVHKAAAEVKGLMKGRTLLGLVNNAGAVFSGMIACACPHWLL